MRNILATVVVCCLAAALVILVLSIIAYNIRLDKAARGERRDAHSSIPEPRTTASVIYKAALLFLVIIMFFNTSSMSGSLTAMQSDLVNLHSTVKELEIQLWQLREREEEREKRVADFNWEILDVDLDKKTARVRISAKLNEYTEDTDVSVSLGGQNAIPLARGGNGMFSTVITAGIFDTYSSSEIFITENGKTVSEDVYYYGYLFNDILPTPQFVSSSWSHSQGLKGDILNGEYSIFVDNPELLESVSATHIVDGVTVKSMDITEQVKNTEIITIGKNIKVERSVSVEIEVLAKSGFRIVRCKPMFITEYGEIDHYLRVFDQNGNMVYEQYGDSVF